MIPVVLSGNTVVVVEHDRHMIESANYLVELGPQSGERGGEIVCSAPTKDFIRDKRALTARYLRGDEQIPLPKSRRSGNGKVLVIAGATEHNLKDLVVRLPTLNRLASLNVSNAAAVALYEIARRR